VGYLWRKSEESKKQMIDVTYIDHMGSDLSVVNAARVSFGKKSELVEGTVKQDEQGEYLEMVLSERDTKLIRYLAKHKHISPFGHAFASFHVKAPVFVARQLVKHKFLRWNEISRRYVDEEPEFYSPDVWRGRSADKKQGSEGEVDFDPHCVYLPDHYYYRAEDICIDVYEAMLDAGVAPEQARMVLPQSMMTEWYWSGSLDAFADMCHLRCKPDTQAETREVAEKIEDLMMNHFPVSWEALRMYAE
jgi:thymidylate synthase (FAD)